MSISINEDIRHIVEAELQPGEKLLWAEMTDQEKRASWLKEQIRSDKFWAPFGFALGTFFSYFLLVAFIEDDLNANIIFALLEVLVMVFLISCMFFVFWFSVKAYWGKSVHNNSFPIGFYALTDRRLLIFGLEGHLLEVIKSSNVKSAKIYKRMKWNFTWVPRFIIISPVDNGRLGLAELYFLPNYECSCSQINNAIGATT